jgi:cell division protein FtsN
MPSTQPSYDNSALIGGVVGGVVALLIVVGVIAFIVIRSRKAKANQQSTNDGHSLSPRNPNNSDYDRVMVTNTNEYGDVNDVRANL